MTSSLRYPICRAMYSEKSRAFGRGFTTSSFYDFTTLKEVQTVTYSQIDSFHDSRLWSHRNGMPPMALFILHKLTWVRPRLKLTWVRPRLKLTWVRPRLKLTWVRPRLKLTWVRPRLKLTWVRPRLKLTWVRPRLKLTQVSCSRVYTCAFHICSVNETWGEPRLALYQRVRKCSFQAIFSPQSLGEHPKDPPLPCRQVKLKLNYVSSSNPNMTC